MSGFGAGCHAPPHLITCQSWSARFVQPPATLDNLGGGHSVLSKQKCVYPQSTMPQTSPEVSTDIPEPPETVEWNAPACSRCLNLCLVLEAHSLAWEAHLACCDSEYVRELGQGVDAA